MSDIQTLQNMLTGLESKKTQLQADERIFLKMSGINEEIEKAVQDKETILKSLETAKKTRDDLKKKKSESIAATTTKIERKMNELLPSGRAVFSYEEDENEKFNMAIGWNHDKKTTPYNGLSGGEKQIFDTALANVLDANIIVVEAAELDNDNLPKAIGQLAKLDAQVLVSTCHAPPLEVGLIDEFEIIEV
jgi:DNA repair exonuclease SbcCD ATPase subunit